MRPLLLSLVLVNSLAAIAPASSDYLSNFQSYWGEQLTPDVAVHVGRALVAKGYKGCGEYYFRKHKYETNHFVVACTMDGNRWHFYDISSSGNAIEVTSKINLKAELPALKLERRRSGLG
jgi:hypothetical protein